MLALGGQPQYAFFHNLDHCFATCHPIHHQWMLLIKTATKIPKIHFKRDKQFKLWKRVHEDKCPIPLQFLISVSE